MEWELSDVVYMTAECIVGLMSVVGNALVLLAIHRTRALRTVTNCFIGSLAVSDLLVGLVIVPVAVLPKIGLPKDFHGCVLLNTAVVLITNISILSLVDVALERYLAISDPFRYQRVMSKKRALGVVVVTWVVAILLGLVPTMGWNLGSQGFERCEFTKVIDMKYMIYLIFFGVNIPPLLFMLVIYLYIFHIIRKQQKRVVAQLQVLSREERKNQQNRRREVRGAKGLAYVIVLFAVCWIPLHALNSISLFSPNTATEFKYYYQVLLFTVVLSHVNSMINPFLYAFSNSKFKKAMWHIICCSRMQHVFGSDGDTEADSNMRLRATTRAGAAPSSGWSAPQNPAKKATSVAPLARNNGHLSNGNGHINAAFDADSDSEGDQSKGKVLKWEEPVALPNGDSEAAAVENDANQTFARAVQDSHETGDSVIAIGGEPVGDQKDEVSHSPGHVWATPSSRSFQQQDLAAGSAQPDPLEARREQERAPPAIGPSPDARARSDGPVSVEASSLARSSRGDSGRCRCSPALQRPSDANPYLLREHGAGFTETGECTRNDDSDHALHTLPTGKTDTNKADDIDIHKQGLESDDTDTVRPLFGLQVSVPGMSDPTETNAELTVPEVRGTRTVDGDDVCVTLTVASAKDGQSLRDEFDSKEFVSIRL